MEILGDPLPRQWRVTLLVFSTSSGFETPAGSTHQMSYGR